jgi:hypothetical protein
MRVGGHRRPLQNYTPQLRGCARKEQRDGLFASDECPQTSNVVRSQQQHPLAVAIARCSLAEIIVPFAKSFDFEQINPEFLDEFASRFEWMVESRLHDSPIEKDVIHC